MAQCLFSPSTDPTFIAVNQTFIRAVGRTREQLEGKRVFDVFPTNPDLPEDSGYNALRCALCAGANNQNPPAVFRNNPIPHRSCTTGSDAHRRGALLEHNNSADL